MFTSLAAVALTVCLQQREPAEQIYDRVSPSVLTLSVEKGHGSMAIGTAFLALRPGIAVTAWHVLKGARSVTAKFSDGHEARVSGVVDKNVDLDIALIQVESGDRKPLQLAVADPKVGAKAYVIGAPRGLECSISDGIISQTPLFNSGKLYQFTCPVSPGNSGGPLLNASGEVLGVVSWQLKDAQNLNFAVPVGTLSALKADKAASEFQAAALTDESTSPVVVVADDALLGSVVEEADMTYKLEDDGTGINALIIKNGSADVSLFQYSKDGKKGPTTNLSINVGYQTDRPVDLYRINAFNRSHRFVRSYRSSDGILYIEDDLNLNLGVGRGNIRRFVTTFMDTVDEFEADVLQHPRSGSRAEFLPSQPTGGQLCSSVTDNQIEALLSECGFKGKRDTDEDGATRYVFNIGPNEATLCLVGDNKPTDKSTSLTLSIGFSPHSKPSVERVNAFNDEARFFKAFLDEEGDPFLVADLDLHGGVTTESIKEFIRGFAKAVPVFVTFVLGG